MEDPLPDPPVVGPYRLLGVLGSGGMGVVYSAEQRAPIHRRVAVKVIKVGMDTKEVLARFEAERQALASLDHPHIAKVLEAGETAAGKPYFAMELVRGQPITEFCDARQLSIRERLEIVLQACAALGHANERGIIHRDIKPRNLLVADVDGRPHVKVIDFGLAKAVNQRLTERTLFTEQGRLIGTPEYMSPEQADMSSQDVDARSDVYSLGVVIYEVLAGVLPFDFGTVRAKGYLELQRHIREEDAPTPSQRLRGLRELLTIVLEARKCRLRDLAQSFRNGLDAVVMKAIAKQRRHRYATCQELAADLRRYLAGEPVHARRSGTVRSLRNRVRRLWRRHPSVLPLLLAVCVILAFWTRLRGEGDMPLPDGSAPDAVEKIVGYFRPAGPGPKWRSDLQPPSAEDVELGSVRVLLNSPTLEDGFGSADDFRAAIVGAFQSIGMRNVKLLPRKAAKVAEYELCVYEADADGRFPFAKEAGADVEALCLAVGGVMKHREPGEDVYGDNRSDHAFVFLLRRRCGTAPADQSGEERSIGDAAVVAPGEVPTPRLLPTTENPGWSEGRGQGLEVMSSCHEVRGAFRITVLGGSGERSRIATATNIFIKRFPTYVTTGQ